MRSSVLLLAAALLVLGCRDIRAEANMAEAMSQMETQFAAIQQDYAILQQQVDSLRMALARQDTTISRLSQQLANLPIPR